MLGVVLVPCVGLLRLLHMSLSTLPVPSYACWPDKCPSSIPEIDEQVVQWQVVEPVFAYLDDILVV